MDAIEIAGTESIEVVAQFDGAIVDVTHLVHDARRGRSAEREAYTIGPDPRASLPVAAALPSPLFSLVRVDDAGGFVLDVAPGMPATRTVGDATTPLSPGTHPLAAGARARVEAGGATFFVANVPAPRRHALPRAIDWSRQVYLGAVTLAVSTFLLLVYAIPPSPASLALDLDHDTRMARFVLTPPALPPPPPAPGPTSDTASAGHAARERAGALGKPTATRRTGQLRLPGPVSREKMIAAAQSAARSAGILAILRAQNGSQVGSVFGPGNALGDGANEILLGLHGDAIADAYGTGLDELGHDRGGGGDGDHTIGVGPLHTIGFCRGGHCRDGAHSYADSAPTASLVRRARAPDVVPGQATVRCGLDASCLDKEIVRRVIRQHHNEVRYCYERGLAARPELAGRVVTAFTIAATGRVLGSSVTESSLADRDVESCIAAAVRRWEFPSSAQMTSVSYPFVLAPPR